MWAELIQRLVVVVFFVFVVSAGAMLAYCVWLFLRPSNHRSRNTWRSGHLSGVLSEYDQAMALADRHGVSVSHEDLLLAASDPDQDAQSCVRLLIDPVWFDLPGGDDHANGLPARCGNGDPVLAWGRVGLTLRGRREVDAVGVAALLQRCGRELAKALRQREDAFDASIRLEALGNEVCHAMDLFDNDSAFHVVKVKVTRVQKA